MNADAGGQPGFLRWGKRLTKVVIFIATKLVSSHFVDILFLLLPPASWLASLFKYGNRIA